jgi:predicted RNA-binding Zn ribbon-like protein
MNDAGKQDNSDWRDGFLFLGNQLALDFLNTRPIPASEPVELLPDLAAVLRWFQAAELLGPREAAKLLRQWAGSRRATQVLEVIRELRERLRKEVVAWESGVPVHKATIDELNSLMAEHPMRARLAARGRTLTLEPYFAPQKPEDLDEPSLERSDETHPLPNPHALGRRQVQLFSGLDVKGSVPGVDISDGQRSIFPRRMDIGQHLIAQSRVAHLIRPALGKSNEELLVAR